MINIPDIVTEEEIEKFFETISYNVKRLRNEKGLSQLEVALSIGQKSSGFYANTENYKHGKHFNLLHFLKLSKFFNYTPGVESPLLFYCKMQYFK
ncbi:MAG: XRE family transcriptional regulator [Sulfurimonadaceae bacterium]